MLDQTDRDALEAMVDRYNAHAVIAGLAEICLEKAAWVESPEKLAPLGEDARPAGADRKRDQAMTKNRYSRHIKAAVANGRGAGIVWAFDTKRFRITLTIEPEVDYLYDGDDDGETQAMLDRGEYVAFRSTVSVELDGIEIASDSLGGSVYATDGVSEFWTAHRDPDPMNRNCSIMREARGPTVCICHYFPGMVREAISLARDHLRTAAPYMRASA